MDEVVENIEEIFVEHLNGETYNMRFFAMLETLDNKNSGFTYALCYDDDGKLSGFV